jgi:hypothetical protein
MQTPTARWSHTDGAQRNLTEQAATTAIDTACRLLRLPSIRNGFAEIAAGPSEGPDDLPGLPRRAADD